MSTEPQLDPASDPRTSAVPSGWVSSELWLSMAAVVVGAVLSSGILPEDSPWIKVLGIVAAVLASLGYTWARTALKLAASRGAVELARNKPGAP